jgi:hypothetical protein
MNRLNQLAEMIRKAVREQWREQGSVACQSPCPPICVSLKDSSLRDTKLLRYACQPLFNELGVLEIDFFLKIITQGVEPLSELCLVKYLEKLGYDMSD